MSNKNIFVMGIKRDSLIDGEGVRDVIFVSGCDKACKGCQNQESWKVGNGKSTRIDELADRLLDKPSIKGITISGGDPLSFQRYEVLELVREIKNKHPEVNIWLYTGMTWEEMLGDESVLMEIMSYIDVLVDGRFVEAERDITLRFRGSMSQRIVDVQPSLQQGKVVLYEC